MDARSLLRIVAHRPFPLPAGPWVMTQTWHDLLFVHWRVRPELLRPCLPDELTIDTFDGDAWLSVGPFWLWGIRLRWTRPIPFASGFPVLHGRTYGRYGNRPGVYFLSLDAPHRLLSTIARYWFHLRYVSSRTRVQRSREWIEFTSRRRDGRGEGGMFEALYRPCGAARDANDNDLTRWLVERYRLYAGDRSGGLWQADIHHRPWMIQPAEAQIKINTMPLAHGLPSCGSPAIVHFAKHMEVLVWAPRRVELSSSNAVDHFRCGSGKSRYRADRKSVTIE